MVFLIWVSCVSVSLFLTSALSHHPIPLHVDRLVVKADRMKSPTLLLYSLYDIKPVIICYRICRYLFQDKSKNDLQVPSLVKPTEMKDTCGPRLLRRCFHPARSRAGSNVSGARVIYVHAG